MFSFFKKLKEKGLERKQEEKRALQILDNIIRELEVERDDLIMDLEEQIRSKLNEEEGYDYGKSDEKRNS